MKQLRYQVHSIGWNSRVFNKCTDHKSTLVSYNKVVTEKCLASFVKAIGRRP